MFRIKNQNKTQYGTFKTNKNTPSLRKFWSTENLQSKKAIKIASVAGVTMVALIFGAILLFNKNKDLTNLTQIPTANASDIPGWWYKDYFDSVVCDNDRCKPEADPDEDKLTNSQEFFYHTDPLNPRTVGDNMNDGELVAKGFDPSRPGQKTFEEVMSQDHILGESLLLEQDIVDITNESKDISKVKIPVLPESELKITYDETEPTYQIYFSDLGKTIDKYFADGELDDIQAILETGSNSDVDEIKKKAFLLSANLKKITIPSRMITYHQYIISFYNLVSLVIADSPYSGDPSSPQSDVWFENMQAFLAVTQKLNFEQQALNISLQNQQ